MRGIVGLEDSGLLCWFSNRSFYVAKWGSSSSGAIIAYFHSIARVLQQQHQGGNCIVLTGFKQVPKSDCVVIPSKQKG